MVSFNCKYKVTSVVLIDLWETQEMSQIVLASLFFFLFIIFIIIGRKFSKILCVILEIQI